MIYIWLSVSKLSTRKPLYAIQFPGQRLLYFVDCNVLQYKLQISETGKNDSILEWIFEMQSLLQNCVVKCGECDN